VSRNRQEQGWLGRAWHLLAFREPGDDQTVLSPSQRVEHEAYGLLACQRAKVRVPNLVGTRTLDEEESLLLREWVDATPLSELTNEQVDDAVLADLWRQVAALHGLGAAHRSLRADHLAVDPSGNVWLFELAGARLDADPEEQHRDIAELCASLSETVEPARVVSSAASGLGQDALRGALVFLQPLALTPPTRRKLANHEPSLDTLRKEVAAAAGVDAGPVQAPLRVAARNLLPLVAGLFLINLLLPQVGHSTAFFNAARRANWSWLVAVGAATVLTYIMGTITALGAIRESLPFGRTFIVQSAAAFTNRLAPGGLGGMATNVRYFEAAGIPRAEAITSVGVRSAASFVVHLAGVGAIVPLLGASNIHLRFSGPPLPDEWPYLVAAVGVLAVIGLARWGRFLVLLVRRVGRRLDPHLRVAWAGLAGTVSRPVSALALFGGAAGSKAAYALALAASTQAFGIHLPLGAVTAVYLGGSAIGSLAPTPGGLGGVEAALVAGLTAAGAPAGPAVASVLTYRLITYWLPILPGALAFRSLRRSGAL
jgi:undecaprenyl-diphosphatase